jgi:hypothetical protein
MRGGAIEAALWSRSCPHGQIGLDGFQDARLRGRETVLSATPALDIA